MQAGSPACQIRCCAILTFLSFQEDVGLGGDANMSISLRENRFAPDCPAILRASVMCAAEARLSNVDGNGGVVNRID